MTSKTTHYHHKVVGFWGLRPQAPTGGSILDSTGGLPFPRPPEFLLPSGKVLATPLAVRLINILNVKANYSTIIQSTIFSVDGDRLC